MVCQLKKDDNASQQPFICPTFRKVNVGQIALYTRHNIITETR
ncbi:hypothetical protein HMPREF6745_0601 [Prevotella sp. oral taxon 472 str. F0295]|nr:hypothetical protein HMPREF6745_0601 [Prevotella sp. oral taxon 472 str. F0295]